MSTIAEDIQELLDLGLTQTEIAKEMGFKHRQQVHKIIERNKLEKYVPFDESGNEVCEAAKPPLDVLDDIKRSVYYDGDFYLPMILKDEWLATEKYVKEKYGGIISYFDGRGESFYLDLIYKECVSCGYRKLSEFAVKGGYWNLERECTTCRNTRLRAWTEKHQSLNKVRVREWRRSNPEMQKEAVKRRRLLEEGLPTDEDIDKYIEELDGKCSLTGSEDRHIEHFVPVSWGHYGTVKGNLYLLKPLLNFSKGAQNPFEWFKYAETEFGLDRNKFNGLVAKLAELNGLTTEQFRSFVYWCDANRRTPEEAAADRRSSVEIWKEAIGWTE